MKFIIFLLLSVQVHAAYHSNWEFVVSTTSLPISSVTTSDDAKKSLLGDLYNPFGFKYYFSTFSIQLTTSKISLLKNKDKDNGLTTTITQLEGNYVLNPSSSVLWETQAGIMMYEMKGSGGQTVLNNGNGTSTFTLPSKTSNSQLVYLGIGPKFVFDSFTLDMDLNFLSLLSSTRRSYFLTLSLGVPL